MAWIQFHDWNAGIGFADEAFPKEALIYLRALPPSWALRMTATPLQGSTARNQRLMHSLRNRIFSTIRTMTRDDEWREFPYLLHLVLRWLVWHHEEGLKIRGRGVDPPAADMVLSESVQVLLVIVNARPWKLRLDNVSASVVQRVGWARQQVDPQFLMQHHPPGPMDLDWSVIASAGANPWASIPDCEMARVGIDTDPAYGPVAGALPLGTYLDTSGEIRAATD